MPEKKKTFTARDGEQRFIFQKVRYRQNQWGGRDKISDHIGVTLQYPIEFDVQKVCKEVEYFRDLCDAEGVRKDRTDKGYLKDGQRVVLKPEDLQEFLEYKVDKENKACYWVDRPRSAKEREFEQAIAKKDAIIEQQAQELEALRKKAR